MIRAGSLRREALLAAGIAAAVAAVIVWAGPPSGDLPTHEYQRLFFIDHGFALWNNYWYSGRYEFVTYSVLYYPLAALLGIRVLAVLSIAIAAAAFTVVTGQEWGDRTLWPSRAFALVWGAAVLRGTFPFLLGAAFALLALGALRSRRLAAYSVLALLTLAASPLAFLLLVLAVCAFGLARRPGRRLLLAAGLPLVVLAVAQAAAIRLFPGGTYPFPLSELGAALGFAALGVALTIGVREARPLRNLFVLFAIACAAAYLVDSGLGENMTRLRYAAIPLTVLALMLRGRTQRAVAAVALGIAAAWNLSPLLANVLASSDPAAQASYWAPAVRYLKAHRTPSYRVEAVETVGHWPSFYVARAGIPIARGWFRQDDFPQNAVLYHPLTPAGYVAWLRRVGVRYVVLTDAPPDYSSRAEAALLRSGRTALRPVLQAPDLTVYELPRPRGIASGPGRPRVISLEATRLVVHVGAGRSRIAVRFTPYWHPSTGCVSRAPDGMTWLDVTRPGNVSIDFGLTAGRALDELTHTATRACAG